MFKRAKKKPKHRPGRKWSIASSWLPWCPRVSRSMKIWCGRPSSALTRTAAYRGIPRRRAGRLIQGIHWKMKSMVITCYNQGKHRIYKILTEWVMWLLLLVIETIFLKVGYKTTYLTWINMVNMAYFTVGFTVLCWGLVLFWVRVIPWIVTGEGFP